MVHVDRANVLNLAFAETAESSVTLDERADDLLPFNLKAKSPLLSYPFPIGTGLDHR